MNTYNPVKHRTSPSIKQSGKRPRRVTRRTKEQQQVEAAVEAARTYASVVLRTYSNTEVAARQVQYAPLRSDINTVIRHLCPSASAETQRNTVLSCASELLERAGFETCLVGSYGLRTYLPDSDIDLVIRRRGCVDCSSPKQVGNYNNISGLAAAAVANSSNGGGAWYMRVNEALCMASAENHAYHSHQRSSGRVRNVSFVPGQVKVVNCTINNISVDVSEVTHGPLACMKLYDNLDRRIGRNHLFKRSVILIKGWLKHDALRVSTLVNAVDGQHHRHHSHHPHQGRNKRNKRRGGRGGRGGHGNHHRGSSNGTSVAGNGVIVTGSGGSNGIVGANGQDLTLLGARGGGLSSCALLTLVASVFFSHLEPPNEREKQEGQEGQKAQRQQGQTKQEGAIPFQNTTLNCTIHHPLDALVEFFRTYADFDWSRYCVTISGKKLLQPLRAATPTTATGDDDGHHQSSSGLSFLPPNNETPPQTPYQLSIVTSMVRAALGPMSDTSDGRHTIASISSPQIDGRLHVQRRSCTVVDPMNPTNNLAKSLQHDRLRVFVRALLCGRRALADDLAHVASAAAAAAVAREKNSSGGGKKKNGGGGMTSRGVASGTTTELFDTCCQLYGRGDGWRPDLLVHPCQQWVPEQRWSNQRGGVGDGWGGDEENSDITGSFDPMASRTKHLSKTSHALSLLVQRGTSLLTDAGGDNSGSDLGDRLSEKPKRNSPTPSRSSASWKHFPTFPKPRPSSITSSGSAPTLLSNEFMPPIFAVAKERSLSPPLVTLHIPEERTRTLSRPISSVASVIIDEGSCIEGSSSKDADHTLKKAEKKAEKRDEKSNVKMDNKKIRTGINKEKDAETKAQKKAEKKAPQQTQKQVVKIVKMVEIEKRVEQQINMKEVNAGGGVVEKRSKAGSTISPATAIASHLQCNSMSHVHLFLLVSACVVVVFGSVAGMFFLFRHEARGLQRDDHKNIQQVNIVPSLEVHSRRKTGRKRPDTRIHSTSSTKRLASIWEARTVRTSEIKTMKTTETKTKVFEHQQRKNGKKKKRRIAAKNILSHSMSSNSNSSNNSNDANHSSGNNRHVGLLAKRDLSMNKPHLFTKANSINLDDGEEYSTLLQRPNHGFCSVGDDEVMNGASLPLLYYSSFHRDVVLFLATDTHTPTDNDPISDKSVSSAFVSNEAVLEEEEQGLPPPPPPKVHSHRSRQWTTVGSQTLLGAEVEKIDGQILTYQWRRNGVDVFGAISALYVISPVRMEDAGTYTCAVTSNGASVAIWEEVMLHVNSPPEVEQEFRRVVVHAGAKFTLAVPFVMANPAPTFQWRLNGVDIPGAVERQYDVDGASVDDVGTYTCEVKNIAGKAIFEEYLVEVA